MDTVIKFLIDPPGFITEGSGGASEMEVPCVYCVRHFASVYSSCPMARSLPASCLLSPFCLNHMRSIMGRRTNRPHHTHTHTNATAKVSPCMRGKLNFTQFFFTTLLGVSFLFSVERSIVWRVSLSVCTTTAAVF